MTRVSNLELPLTHTHETTSKSNIGECQFILEEIKRYAKQAQLNFEKSVTVRVVPLDEICIGELSFPANEPITLRYPQTTDGNIVSMAYLYTDTGGDVITLDFPIEKDKKPLIRFIC